MKIVVVDGYTLNPGDLSWAGFDSLGELQIYERTPPEWVLTRCAGAQVVLSNKVVFNREVLQQLPELRYLGVLATGYNSVVDLQAAEELGVVVTNIPTYGTDSVAQFVLAQLLSWVQPVRDYSLTVAEDWPQSPDFCYCPLPQRELAGKTIGLIGYGAIGQRVAQLARAFGMSVLVHSRTPPKTLPEGVAYVDLPTLLSASDVVSLHCPLTDSNRAMVDEVFLRRMKSTALLINTARGGLVEESALYRALVEGWIAGALLDVLSVEPPPADHPLLRAPNCRITPHIAWATHEARARLMAIAQANLQAFLRGAPVNRVYAAP